MPEASGVFWLRFMIRLTLIKLIGTKKKKTGMNLLKKKSDGTKNSQMIRPAWTPAVQTGLSGPVHLKRSNQKRIKTAAGTKTKITVKDEAGREFRS